MPDNFFNLAVTPSVRRAQERCYGRSLRVAEAPSRDALGLDECEFIRSRDSFYLATVSEHGWPYIQHRGGQPGFLQPIGPATLAFADLGGNRQLITTGNVAANDRVALFLIDYPKRTRLKILGHARAADPKDHPANLERLVPPELHAKVERLFMIDVVAFDWNCPKYITPRYNAAEVDEALRGLRARIAELEAQLHVQKTGKT
jgi:uncharacterized protein